MAERSLRHRAPLLWLVLPWMAGLIVAHTFPLPIGPGWLLAGGVLVVCLALGSTQSPVRWACLLSLGFALGGHAFYQIKRHRLPAWDRLPLREARLTVRVDRVFAPQPGFSSQGGLGRIVDAEPHLAELIGQRIYFSATRPTDGAAFIRSQHLSLVGLIAALPRDTPADTFEGFLAQGGLNFTVTRGRLIGEAKPPLAYYRFCAAAHRRLVTILNTGLAHRPELAAIVRAMVLGEASGLSDNQNAVFQQSGTLHLFSISGLHIATIAAALEALLLLLRLPAKARFITGTLILWLYVDITGAPPSAVRAFLMVAAVHGSFVFRVPGNAIAAITASALLVLVIAPFQLFGASFQMSYGIVAALLLHALPLAERWQTKVRPFALLPRASWRWPHLWTATAWRYTTTVLALTASAGLIGAVAGVQFFQLFTPVAWMANLALIPAASGVLFAGFISLLAGLAGLLTPAVLFNHAAALVALTMQWAVEWATMMPGAYWPAHYRWPWIGPVALILVLTAMAYGYARRWRGAAASFWLPVVLVTLILVFGVQFG